MYLSNRQHQPIPRRRKLTIDGIRDLLHNNIEDEAESEMKQHILKKIHHGGIKYKFDQMVCDPSVLGRYMNFKGATSLIANYIKGLEKIVRQNFVITESHPFDYLEEKPRRRYIRNLESPLRAVSQTVEINRSQFDIDYIKEKQKQKQWQPQALQHQNRRIHFLTPGRIIKPIYSPTRQSIECLNVQNSGQLYQKRN